MVRFQAPDATEFLARARALTPRIAEMAPRAEQEREIPPEVIADLKDAGLFRLYQPAEFGGHELPYARLQLELSIILGAVCASTAWVQGVLAVHGWLLGSFPSAAQQAVWGDNPDALVSTAFSYSEARVEQLDGGLRLSGCWEFSSGVGAADWIVLRTPVTQDDGQLEMRLCLVAKRDVEVVDVWRAIGLRGTGSNDVRMEGLFVPDAHIIGLVSLRGDGRRAADAQAAPLFTLPHAATFPFSVAAPAIGAARGALASFRAAHVDGSQKRALATRQLRFSEVAVQVDCAELLMRETARRIDDAVAAGALMDSLDRATIKRNLSHATGLCRAAVARLVEMLGAHGLPPDQPVQRAYRDLLAIGSHAGLNWETAGEIYGRCAFGLPSGDPMI